MSSSNHVFPSDPWIAALVKQGLMEDIGTGDVTTAVTGDESGAVKRGVCRVSAREAGFIAGLPILDILFGQLDQSLMVERLVEDGTRVKPGQTVAILRGAQSSILTGERTALNFLQHLGGIATLTAAYVAEVAGTGCHILDTRKTIPGYRHLAKYAVRCGGGHNHRMGLYDRVMLKDNHWAVAGGAIDKLVERSREMFPDLAIEVEVDSIAQLRRVLPLNVDWILLDNFDFEMTAEAVVIRDNAKSKSRLESSGNVDLSTVAQYAAQGVDAASVGRLTHSAPSLDLGFDMEDS